MLYVTFFPSKAGLVWKFFSEGAKSNLSYSFLRLLEHHSEQSVNTVVCHVLLSMMEYAMCQVRMAILPVVVAV